MGCKRLSPLVSGAFPFYNPRFCEIQRKDCFVMSQTLWTPWRMDYVRGPKQPVEGCIFCNKITADSAQEHVLARSAYVYVTLNLYPYNTGHLMVVPYEHVSSQESLETEALSDMMLNINRGLAVLRKAYNPPAFNIGANLGQAAGAGIAEHFHFHIVPRWPGDANFMSVIGETRIIPDTIDHMYEELRGIWNNLYGD
jgi:ATP adenylyltransferase